MKIRLFTLCFLLVCGTAFAGTTDKLKSVIARMNVAAGGDSALYTAATAIWDFDNDATDTKGTHNLSVTGTMVYTGTGPDGSSHYADCDSSANRYFSVADHVDFQVTGSDYSLSYWVHTGGNNSSLFSKGSSQYGYSGRVTTYYLAQHYDNFTATELSATTAQPNAWTHVVVTYDFSTTTLTLYQTTLGSAFGNLANGVEDTSAEPPTDAGDALTIGRRWTSTSDSNFDEFVFWKGTVLTAAEAEDVFDGDWR